jgi:hypothetical protein
MKSSLLVLFAAVVAPSLLVLGCGDDNGSQDMAAGPDLSAAAKDMTMKPCTMVATWPSDDIEVVAGETESAPFDFVTIGHALKTTGGQIDAVSVELWHQPSTPSTLPRTVTLPANGDYNTCETCVLLDENYDPDQGFGEIGYFARAGSITITKADTNPGMGMMQVSGSDVKLVEWDFMNDKPVTNGKCYEVGSFSMSGSYSNPDGGADM